MDITITGRGVDVPDRFEDYATEKSEKIEKLAERALALEIKLVRHHESRGQSGDDRVELTLIGPGPLVRAEAAAADKYAAFDLAFDKLVERIRQAKDRKKVHRGQHRPPSFQEAMRGGSATWCPPAWRRSSEWRPAPSRRSRARRPRTGARWSSAARSSPPSG